MHEWRGTATSGDLDKARSTLRQFYRDWSAEGASERAACLGPVIDDLQLERTSRADAQPMNVLVPGAGLGRLVFELCKDGFDVEGNEISYHQLLASSYILNHCPEAHHHTIYPWVHSFSNHRSRANQLHEVKIPDVHPGYALEARNQEGPAAVVPGQMSMSASDFLCLYGDDDHKEVFDAVATVFFLDTAPNPIRYIETIRHCLRPGGIWTNLGPLLWHFENNPPGSHSHGHDGDKEDVSQGRLWFCKVRSITTVLTHEVPGIGDPGGVELTDDEVAALVERFGFKIEKREGGIEAGYIQDPTSMVQNIYRVSHWVARKS